MKEDTECAKEGDNCGNIMLFIAGKPIFQIKGQQKMIIPIIGY